MTGDARLSPLDTAFFHVEDQVSHMHLGSVSLFEGPPPAHEEVLAAIDARLPRARRFRQKARFVPLGAGRPVWVDDPRFELDYHVRRTALPRPGEAGELRRLVGRVMSHQLDRNRPLWEMWVVEGLPEARWAVISKLHHSMVDGVSASSLITALMDEERDAPPPAERLPEPGPEPTGAELLLDALTERMRHPLGGLGLTGALRHPRPALGRAAQVARGMAEYARLARVPEPTSLNGPLGPHRCWDWARVRLSEVKEVRAAFGGTVNDVVLAVISHGFAELRRARGEPLDVPLRSLVPVSVRTPGEHGEYNNKVSAIFLELPIEVARPVAQLHAVHARMEHLKRSHEPEAGEVLTTLGGVAPELVFALAVRTATRLPQHAVATVTTNVPGPQRPLYFARRRMLESLPYVPLAGHVRVGVAIYSYDGGLAFGVTGDHDAAPDIGVLCAGIEDGMAALLAAARGTAPGPARRGLRSTSPTWELRR